MRAFWPKTPSEAAIEATMRAWNLDRLPAIRLIQSTKALQRRREVR